MLAQRLCGFADLALAGKEDENVALLAWAAHRIYGVEDSVRGVLFVFLLRVHLERSVAHFDRIEPPRHLDHRRATEVLREALGVDRGGSDDELEIGPLRQQLTCVAEQEIDVEAAFVGLVEDQGIVGGEQPIGLRFREQDAVGHDLHARFLAHVILEPDLVADGFPEGHAKLVRDAVRDGARGDAPRLGVSDEPGGAAAEVETDLRNLRRFAGTGFTTDDDDLVPRQRGGDLDTLGRDGKLRGKGRLRQRRSPRFTLRARCGDVLRQRLDLRFGRALPVATQVLQSARETRAIAGQRPVEIRLERVELGQNSGRQGVKADGRSSVL